MYGSVTKIAGALLHLRQGTVDIRLAGRLAMTSVPAGLTAVALLRWLSRSGISADDAVRRALGAVLMLVAVVLLARLLNLVPHDIPDR